MKEAEKILTDSNRKRIKKNTIYGLSSQVLMMVLGLIVPRLILVSYGSETNGLLSTVVQIFTYVGLLEAGIGNAALNALYKPVADENQYGISCVFSAAQKYYRKVTITYVGCVVALSLLYPLFVSSDLGYSRIALVVFFQGLSGALNFYFVAAYQQVLKADGKNYIVTNIQMIIYVMTSIAKVIMMSNGYDVVFLQLTYCVIHSIQIVIFKVVMRNKYPWLSYHNVPDMTALKERSAFMIHEFSSMVFSSTDMLVLSTFCNLKVTSVYSVYNLVFIALNTLINSVNGGLHYILGQSYAKQDGTYEKKHDIYDSLYMCFVFTAFTTAYVLICPFVAIYTRGITDVAYVDYKLPILFVLIQLLSCGRATSARVITISGHAKATQWRSLFEAGINLLASLILVKLLGIYGVLLATIIALLYRANDIIIYANKIILKRSPMKTYSKLFGNLAVFVLIAVLEYWAREFIAEKCVTWIAFFVFGVCIVTVSFIPYIIVALVTNNDIRYISKKLMKRREKNCVRHEIDEQ